MSTVYRYFYQTDLVKLAETIGNSAGERRSFLDEVVNNANYHDFTNDGQTVVKIPASDDSADYRKILELERASGFTCGLVDGMG